MVFFPVLKLRPFFFAFWGCALLTACVSPAGENETQTSGASYAGATEHPKGGDYPLPQATTLCEGLDVPWGMDLLPSGDLLITERPGQVTWINATDGSKKTILERSVLNRGEGGLLGLAVHPEFENNGWVYLYETSRDGNRIVRLRAEPRTLKAGQAPERFTEERSLDNIPHARFHDGGILRFGPDGLLYAGTGDARQPELASDTSLDAGKILRMTAELEPAPGNPFPDHGRGLVYSMGHRNVQGLAWDAEGGLWAAEHGPSGEINGWCCHDELNRIRPGAHYGWPHVIGDQTKQGTIPPYRHSGSDTWAPGGCAVLGPAWGGYAGSVVVAGLRGNALYRFAGSGSGTASSDGQAWFKDRYGRLRNVLVAADGQALYLTTSNRDGRGRPREGDDRILVLRPSAGP